MAIYCNLAIPALKVVVFPVIADDHVLQSFDCPFEVSVLINVNIFYDQINIFISNHVL